METDISKHSGSKYVRWISALPDTSVRGGGLLFQIQVDVYCILDAFQPVNDAVAHALKKLLCAGSRGKADVIQDLKEARDALTRAIQMEEARQEAEKFVEPQPPSPGPMPMVTTEALTAEDGMPISARPKPLHIWGESDSEGDQKCIHCGIMYSQWCVSGMKKECVETTQDVELIPVSIGGTEKTMHPKSVKQVSSSHVFSNERTELRIPRSCRGCDMTTISYIENGFPICAKPY